MMRILCATVLAAWVLGGCARKAPSPEPDIYPIAEEMDAAGN